MIHCSVHLLSHIVLRSAQVWNSNFSDSGLESKIKLDMVDELFIHLSLKLLQFIEKKNCLGELWYRKDRPRFRFPWIRLFSHFLEGFSTNRMMQMQLSSTLLSEFNPLTPKYKIISHSFTGSFCFVSYVCFLLSYICLQLFNFFC